MQFVDFVQIVSIRYHIILYWGGLEFFKVIGTPNNLHQAELGHIYEYLAY
jgi:hypothetical protein